MSYAKPVNIKRIFLALCLGLIVVLALIGVFIFLNIRSYYSLKGEELIGVVHCKSEKTKVSLKFERIIKGKFVRTMNYAVYGDEWVLIVEVLKWPDFLGVAPVYKVTRITSRHKDEITSSDCIDSGPGFLWAFLIKYPKSVPFIQAIKGEVTFPVPEETAKYYIYISQSGLMVERESGN